MSGVSKNERIVSLLIHLAASERPSSRARIEEAVEGYAGLASGDEGAEKSFERDVKTLHDIGVQIAFDADGCLYLDSDGAYTRELELEEGDIARLLLIGSAPLGDANFIYREELRSALMKLQGSLPRRSHDASALNTPHAVQTASMDNVEASLVKKLEDCREKRKVVTFTYAKQDGSESTRTVEPLGLFSLEDDWYLLGWDRDRQGEREFRIDRMSALRQKSQAAGPDFAPHDFALRDHIHFPFFFGTEPVFDVAFLIPTYTVREPDYLWDDADLYRIADDEDHLLMVAQARSTSMCARWALEHSPQTLPVWPENVRDAYFEGLQAVMRSADPLAGDDGCKYAELAEVAMADEASPAKRPRKSGRPDGTVETARLLALYTFLEQQGLFSADTAPEEINFIPVSEVATFFGYTDRETEELVSKLACCGADYYLYIPLYVEDGLIYGAPFNGIPRPLRLSINECKALIAALDAAAVPADSPVRAQLIEGAGTPDFNLDSSMSNYIPDADFAKDEAQRSTLDTVLTALVEHKLLRFGYRKLGRDRVERRCVEPLALMLDRGKWHLSAWCLTRDDLRTFNLANIRFPHVSDESFVPHGVQPQRFSTVLESDMPRTILRFDDAATFEYRDWPGATVLEEVPSKENPSGPGALIVAVPWSGSDWLPLHVMAHLGRVKVCDPLELRERAATLARDQHETARDIMRKWERARNGDLLSLDTQSPCPEGAGSLMAALRGTPGHTSS